MGTIDELRSEASGRAVVYSLFSRIFEHEADEALLSELLGDGATVLASLTEVGVEPEAVAALEARAQEAAGDLVELAAEYVRLFEAHKRIYPFASCWQATKPRLMGKPWYDAQKFYSEVGLGVGEDSAVKADHVGFELGFLGVLAGMVAEADSDEAVREGQERYERFMTQIVLPWMPRFFDAVIADERGRFYAAAARVAGQFMAADAAVLGLESERELPAG